MALPFAIRVQVKSVFAGFWLNFIFVVTVMFHKTAANEYMVNRFTSQDYIEHILIAH